MESVKTNSGNGINHLTAEEQKEPVTVMGSCLAGSLHYLRLYLRRYLRRPQAK
ncbi:hypothetical protein [Pontibacter diazotrophicus]|uniref:hypothetical protein n=1 Tax=Pontibacter diazotrophicus TaxID=1400979 RepID=UPI0015F19F76|nr:hypothetical protein [Pontibacter diazotrophicus]